MQAAGEVAAPAGCGPGKCLWKKRVQAALLRSLGRPPCTRLWQELNGTLFRVLLSPAVPFAFLLPGPPPSLLAPKLYLVSTLYLESLSPSAGTCKPTPCSSGHRIQPSPSRACSAPLTHLMRSQGVSVESSPRFTTINPWSILSFFFKINWGIL